MKIRGLQSCRSYSADSYILAGSTDCSRKAFSFFVVKDAGKISGKSIRLSMEGNEICIQETKLSFLILMLKLRTLFSLAFALFFQLFDLP